MHYSNFVEKYINTNPYISSVIGYHVLSRFSKGVVAVMKIILENRQTFLDSFYNDVVANDDLLVSDLNSVNDNALINAYRNLNTTTLNDVNKTLRFFFKEELPASLGIIRFIKGMHGFASGFIDALETDMPFLDSENDLASLNGRSSRSAVKYLINSRKCRLASFAFTSWEGAYNSESLSTVQFPELHSDSFDQGLAGYSEKSSIKALLPMIYDIKNTITFPNEADAQADLIGKHLFGSLDSKISDIKSDVTSTPPSPVDTQKDITHMWDKDLGIDYSVSGMSQLDLGKLLYSDLQDGRNLLVVDNKGYTNDKVTGENNVTLKNYAFGIANMLRGEDNNTEVSRICNDIKVATDNILKDIIDNYGVAGLSEFSDLPEEYIDKFFEFVADELINPTTNAPDGAGSDDDAVPAFVSTLLLLVANTNEQFQKDLFKQGCWHYAVHTGFIDTDSGNGLDFVRLAQPRQLIPRTNSQSKHKGYDKLRQLSRYGTEASSGLQQSDNDGDNTVDYNFYTHDPNESFTETLVWNGYEFGDPLNAYYGRDITKLQVNPTDVVFNYMYYNIIPGTKNTSGKQNLSENESKSLTTAGQFNSDDTYGPFDPTKGEYISFSDKPRHFMDESKSDSTFSVGSAIDSSLLHDSIKICVAKNLSDPFKDAINSAVTEHTTPGANFVQKLLNFDANFIKEYESDLQDKIGFNVDDSVFYNTPGNDDQFITSNNALGTSSVSRVYLLYMIIVRMLFSATKLKIMTRGRETRSDSNAGNGARSIEIHYNLENLQGLHDALKSYSRGDNPSSNYNTGYDSAREFIDGLKTRCQHNEAGLLVSAVTLIKIRNFFGNIGNRIQNSFDFTSVANLKEFLENFDNEVQYLDTFSPDQRNLSTFLNMTLLSPSLTNFHLPALKDITNDQIKCMKKFFSQDKYVSAREADLNNRTNQKKYIVHFAITNSLVETLRDKLILQAGIVDFTDDENIRAINQIRDRSIIKINLYRKNLINDKSVQVRSFLFDLNKFVIENINHPDISNLKVSTGLPAASSIEAFLGLHKLYDLRESDSEFSSNLYLSANSIANDDRNNITEEDVNQLFFNHFEDFYLKMYCKSILGLDFDDDVFINNNIAGQVLNMNNDSLNIVQNYNAAFKSHLDDLLSASANDQSYINEKYRIEREAKRSLYFSTERYMKRTLYPKTFDRVFSALVDLNESAADIQSQFEPENSVTLDRFYYTVTLTNLRSLLDAGQSTTSSSNSTYFDRVDTSKRKIDTEVIELNSPTSGIGNVALKPPGLS